MQIALRCGHCANLFLDDDRNELSLEIDCYDQEIRFICRNPHCKKENKIALAPLKKEEKPLPSIGIMRGV